MTRHPFASVIIPAYGRAELTHAAIAAVRRHTDNVEIVVVDNDGNAELADTTRYLRNRRNVGFAVACNQGAMIAKADRFVFLNNDTEVTDGWLEPLIEAVDADAIAGARLLYPSGELQHSGIRIIRDRNRLVYAENLKHEHPSGPVDGVTGACLAINRETFARCGGFDPGYWNGYEDVDLCLTARSLGVSVRYVAESTVVHYESVSGPERWSKVRENIHRLQQRWGDQFDALMAG